MFEIAFSNGASIKGPFLTERAMLFRLPLHNELICAFVVARLVTQCRLAPWSHGMVTLDATFATTVRMVYRIHHHTADGWTNAHVTNTSGLSECHVFMIQISNLANRRHAIDVHQSHLAGRQFHVSISALF